MTTLTQTLPLALSPRSWRLRWHGDDAARAATIVARAQRRGTTICLGTPQTPYAADTSFPHLLDALESTRDITLSIVSADTALFEWADRLAALDRRHVITIGVPVTCDALHPASALYRATRLSELGLDVRLLLPSDAEERLDVEALFADAAQTGIRDLAVIDAARADRETLARLDHLRLRHGFPRPTIGRG